MATKVMARAHVVMPRELLEQVDELVGSRKRSEFIAEAVRNEVRHQRQSRAIRESAGILDPADYPEWEDSAAWVHNLRQADSRHRDKKLGDWLKP
jgi:metal-responsive CopG/Arc/MetJ family transcriptional regulator